MTRHTITITTALLLSMHSSRPAFSIEDTSYKNAASSWVARYVYYNNRLLITQEDVLRLANLCYLSFMRSYHTLKAQGLARQATTALWQGWQNIAQTRLNPSLPAPYAIAQDQQAVTGELFWKEHDEHQRANAAYAHAISYLVTQNNVTTRSAVEAMSDVRSRARTIIARALLDVRLYLSALTKTTEHKGLMDLWKGFCFLKHVASYIPHLALNTLTSADELNNTVSDSGWQALSAVQDLGIQTWQTIEQARASFYAAHYEALSEVAQIINIRVPLMFDHTGFIQEKKRTKILPLHLVCRHEQQ